MSLSDDDFRTIKKLLDERWGTACPTCKRTDTDLIVHGFLPFVMSSDPRVTKFGKGRGITLVTVTCSYCAHTRFLDYDAAMRAVQDV